MHHPIVFILQPLQSQHFINQVSSVTLDKYNHLCDKGKGVFIIGQRQERQKLSKGQLFKVVRAISFFCGSTELELVWKCII